MADYFAMGKAELEQERRQVLAEYERFQTMGLKLDMSRGKPGADQLDLSMGMLSIADYKDDTGVDARNYGNVEGIPEARRFFAEMLGAAPEETFVGGNSSLQLMYLLVDLGWRTGWSGQKPWGEGKPKFLCPSPGYDRHFRVSEVFGFELVTVDMTPTGPDMDQVEALAKDDAVKGIWCIPIYSNPDGYTYSAETVRRLAAMKAAPDFRIFWDNAYGVHHLTGEHETCPNILSECRAAGNEDRPLMFCSTSKITFAGAGVGALAASAGNMAAIVGYFSSTTIGFDKMNQLRHVRFLKKEGGIAPHMEKHAAIIRPKFERVLDIFEEQLGGMNGVYWTKPKGGYFISLFVTPGCARRVVQLCAQAGVVLTGAGAAYPYGEDPADSHIRVAPTFPPISELETAAQLLCIATRLAGIDAALSRL